MLNSAGMLMTLLLVVLQEMMGLVGPRYGYFSNGIFKMELSLNCLVVKEGVSEDAARGLFVDSDIHITTEGHRYLGDVIGSEVFEQQFLQQKLQDWISDIKKLHELYCRITTSRCLFCLLSWAIF